MEFPVKTGSPARHKTACAVIPIFEDAGLSGVGKELSHPLKRLITTLKKKKEAPIKLGSTCLIPLIRGTTIQKTLLVGCGKAAKFDGKNFKEATLAAANALKDAEVKEAINYLGYLPVKGLDAYYTARMTVELTHSSFYRFDELKSKKKNKYKPRKLGVAIKDRKLIKVARQGIKDGKGISAGIDLAKDLANRPPNICTPTHLARIAHALAKKHERLEEKILSERDMKRLGMGALLSVSQGAVEPAKLIVLQYKGAEDRVDPIVICGKGITFDTGGISLKPPPKMDEMKFDMSGAASVLGTMATLGQLKPNINVVALIPACENMPSGQATRPGDIITSMSGQTVEIINTDAEGRLILCDALTYAQRYKPRYLIDVATLTGACVIALGHHCTGLFSNDDGLALSLLEAGHRTYDPAWRLPVGEEHFESLKSNFADFANAGAREGGASIAATFLSKFVGSRPWAHLDIAGTAWLSGKNKGATGRPVALLVDFLLNLSEGNS